MRAVIYDVATGKIHRCVQAKYLEAALLPPGSWIMEGWADITTQKVDTTDPDPNNHFIVDDPELLAATPIVTRQDISKKRKELEEAPLTITMGGAEYFIDYDTYSREIIPKILASWSDITETKVTVEGVEHIAWADANNDVQLFTQAEFTTLADILASEAAKRSDRMHAHARQLIAQLPSVTVAQLDDSSWPTASP